MKTQPSFFVLPLTMGTLLLSACPGAQAPAPTSAVAPIAGTVDIGFARRIQADVAQDIAPAASVSLIEPGATPKTIATTVTTPNGNFVLTVSKNFRPEANTVYYLEAFKGLGSNQAGYNAARLRTLVRYTNGQWSSLTGVGSVGLTLATTAVSLAAELNTREGSAVDLASLLGKLSGAAFTPVTNLSNAEYLEARSVVEQALGGDQDPVGCIGKASGHFFFRSAGGSLGVVPAFGADVGDTLTLSGMAFAATPGANTVSFSGVSAPVGSVSADARSVQLVIPEGARTGAIAVTTASGAAGVVASYPVFGTVRFSLSGVRSDCATVSVALTSSTGSTVVKSQAVPGSTATLSFRGLTPANGWTFEARALNASGQLIASSSARLGPTDPVTMASSSVPGPHAVVSGVNAWAVGLRVLALTGGATGSF